MSRSLRVDVQDLPGPRGPQSGSTSRSLRVDVQDLPGPRGPQSGATSRSLRVHGDHHPGRRPGPSGATRSIIRVDVQDLPGPRGPSSGSTSRIFRVDGDHPPGRRPGPSGATSKSLRVHGVYPPGVWVVTPQYTAGSHEVVRRFPQPALEHRIIPYGTRRFIHESQFALTTTSDPLSIPTYHALIELVIKMISNTYRLFSKLAHGSDIARTLHFSLGRDLLFRFRTVHRRLI